jgi:prepilin-type processing-associated H-X9-DG protein
MNTVGTHMWYQDTYFAGPYLNVRWHSGDYWQGTALDCPSQDVGYMGLQMGYCYNACLGNSPTFASNRFIPQDFSVVRPTRLVMWADALGKGQAPVAADGEHVFECWLRNYDQAFDFRHGRNANVVAADGHVAGAQFEEISYNSLTPFNTRNP